MCSSKSSFKLGQSFTYSWKNLQVEYRVAARMTTKTPKIITAISIIQFSLNC